MRKMQIIKIVANAERCARDEMRWPVTEKLNSLI